MSAIVVSILTYVSKCGTSNSVNPLIFVISCMKIKLQHKLMSRPLYCRHQVESSDGPCSCICLNIQVELWYNQQQFGPVLSYFETLEIKDLLRHQIVFANVPFEMIKILRKTDCIWILIPILDTPP